MTEQSPYRQLADVLRDVAASRRAVLFRGEEELAALHEWLRPAPAPAAATVIVEPTVREAIAACSRCANASEKKLGVGTGQSGFMIVLNAPRLVNRTEKELFRKDAVELLRKMTQAIDVQFNNCYITNLVKCEVEGALAQPSTAVKNCLDLLRAELAAVRPAVVLVMGDIIPLQRLIKESTGILWYNTEHPITLLKNPDLKRPAWNTLKMVREKLQK